MELVNYFMIAIINTFQQDLDKCMYVQCIVTCTVPVRCKV